MNILIPKFKSEMHFNEFRDLAEDKDRLCDNLIEYERTALDLIAQFEKSGEQIIRSDINLVDMVQWLRNNGYPNIGKFRSTYYAEFAKDGFTI